jgi:hypothetical protein
LLDLQPDLEPVARDLPLGVLLLDGVLPTGSKDAVATAAV